MRFAAMAGHAHIGTSGWSYDHWLDRVYPKRSEESRLAHYARSFRSVEINATFYRLPSERAMETWRRETPDGFVFAAKASRFITHMKRLKDPGTHLPIFFDRIRRLGDKLGPVLFQLPPSFRADPDRLMAFLDQLPAHRCALELRHESWWTDGIANMLAERNVAFCLYHLAGQQPPEMVTADLVYVRLHGPGAAYQGSYDDTTLATWCDRLEAWRTEGRDVYLYFDNDEKAYAAEDARRLCSMLA